MSALAAITEIIEDIRGGRMVILVDEEDRENEGDLVMAAEFVTPEAINVEYPAILEFPAPVLPAYPRETFVAEKFQAMTALGIANSRMKDFFDLWVLARGFPFEGPTLSRAIGATFRRRKTDLPAEAPLALTAEFGADPGKVKQ